MAKLPDLVVPWWTPMTSQTLTAGCNRAGKQDQRTTQAFIKEVQVLSSARHPNILQVESSAAP